MNTVAILEQTPDPQIRELARELNLTRVATPADHTGLLLFYQNQRLCLGIAGDNSSGTICVDFTDPKLNFRRQQPLSRESVVKAVGGCVKQSASTQQHLIDATAGLGLDSFILAAAGWQVSMIEQSPVIHALLRDGLAHARRTAGLDQAGNPGLAEVLDRMHLLPPEDSLGLLATLPPARVIYLDPMFPERGKAARVKKNRFLLQQLHGEEAAGDGLLDLAMKLAPKVVVKRPRLAPPLDNKKASASLSGKTSRFDIYVGSVQ